eukprot:CAMPEP_0201478074 /NCGR_PEP_ID=MMETSP0151_2-20130828/2992_1 /ASSEMBLY_ACC=CAM_ASM_000257 /TAXON_ID=200890 /ORGANISM="Paramoeba atlantica, Strain 621/1 / CCAP 1560/9" /LENGTH=177 /DNA_ID=CAMNT_0047859023 /DNA_START=249 /DNA_END=782 /DNA_ORIENTATION=-
MIVAGSLVGGGMAAFSRLRSFPSLIGGCSIGAILAFSGFQIKHRSEPLGHKIGALGGLLLAASSAGRAITTKKYMPAMLSGVGTSTALYNLRHVYRIHNLNKEGKRERKEEREEEREEKEVTSPPNFETVTKSWMEEEKEMGDEFERKTFVLGDQQNGGEEEEEEYFGKTTFSKEKE